MVQQMTLPKRIFLKMFSTEQQLLSPADTGQLGVLLRKQLMIVMVDKSQFYTELVHLIKPKLGETRLNR